LKECGVSEPYQEALKLVGSEPVWFGIAVVFEAEKFGAPGQVEKFDRFERCRKRAEKQATKKRFPNLIQGEAQGEYDDTEPTVTVEQPKPNPLMVDGKTASGKTEQQILSEMGFETQPSAPMSLETATKTKSSDGKVYGDMETPALLAMSKAIQSKIDKNNLPFEEKEEYKFKLDAISVIVASRK
jgi:hypothetical protein